ncbi:hypothetical protein E4K66_20590 [Bradyrhizobium frederickii]|uniref:Uncharacterized protein n=1 Tax=Bradyrhizobium frederickii TaxID=2560054 RepID=A0A4Y9L5J6_9BRAD|nr:hypothetical protein [Bradyrhizobium frederickii]TFV37102.1 hypothetical protein E4K66_20590 [Bradyrhizobium frederickii]
MTLSREITPGSGGAHILKALPDHVAPAPKRRRLVPIRCEPRWRAAAPSLQQEVARLIELLTKQEPPRQRRRRPKDAATFHLAIECIACNLLAVSLAAPERPLAVTLANSASRLTPIFGKPARKVIDLMIELGLITKVKGYPYRGPTTIQATPKLRERLSLGQVKWSALRLEDNAEVLVLKSANRDKPSEDDDTDEVPTRSASAIDKEGLDSLAEDVRSINAAILKAPIECHRAAMAHVSERPGAAMASLMTLHHQGLRRIFNGSWDEGGRLFGGFWQTMPRADRFKHLRIAGQGIGLVDYGQLFLRIAYAEAGSTPEPGDLYDVTGQDTLRPRWKLLRAARKKLINALFFRRAPLKQWPGATLAEVAQIRSAFQPGTTPSDAIKVIRERHAPIAHLFEDGHGLRFMRIESDLIVAVTLALFRRGVFSLPIHDAVAVPRSDVEVAATVMRAEAQRVIGADVPVEIQFAER